MATHTKALHQLVNIPVEQRANLRQGEVIACLLTDSDFNTVWMRVGKVREVSDDGTLVIFDDEETTAAGTVQWLVKTDWIARWS